MMAYNKIRNRGIKVLTPKQKKLLKNIAFWGSVTLIPGGSVLLVYALVKKLRKRKGNITNDTNNKDGYQSV